MGIKNFKHKGLAELFVHGESRRIGDRYVERTKKILSVLDVMKLPEVMSETQEFS